MPADADTEDQDLAEVFDEETTGGDDDLESTYPLDRTVRDETSARGDADVEGDDDALDADEEDDEALADLDDAGEEDDLDEANADRDALDTDDIPDFTADKDFPDRDEEDGVAAHGADEAEVVSMGDLTEADSARRVSDFESDDLSDADLEELG